MTLQQANDFLSHCPEGFATVEQLKQALPESSMRYVGIAGTAGRTTVAFLIASILHHAGLRTGLYTAGRSPLNTRVMVDGQPAEEAIYTASVAALSEKEVLPLPAEELAVACRSFAQAGCAIAVVELPDAGLAAALTEMPVCAVTHIGPDGSGRSIERLAHDAAAVMRAGTICVTAPEQPKAALTEIIVAAGKCDCSLVVPDPEDLSFLKAKRFASQIDYGGYEVPLAFLGRHAAFNAAVAVELALALWRTGLDIQDEAILAGLAAVENQSSIRVIRQRPPVVLDACHTPQQAAALVRVLQMAGLQHLRAVVGLRSEQGAEEFFAALENGLLPEEQKKDKEKMPGMADSVFDTVYLVSPEDVEPSLARSLAEIARFHFEAEICTDLSEALREARSSGHGVVICGCEEIALQAAALLK